LADSMATVPAIYLSLWTIQLAYLLKSSDLSLLDSLINPPECLKKKSVLSVPFSFKADLKETVSGSPKSPYTM